MKWQDITIVIFHTVKRNERASYGPLVELSDTMFHQLVGLTLSYAVTTNVSKIILKSIENQES